MLQVTGSKGVWHTLVIADDAGRTVNVNNATDSVALGYDARKRSRLRVTLASGREAGIFLERGERLQGGDRL